MGEILVSMSEIKENNMRRTSQPVRGEKVTSYSPEQFHNLAICIEHGK